MSSGGKRAGAGRKEVSQEKKRVQISISVAPVTKQRITDLRQQGIRVGEVVDELIREYCEDSQ